ncbi:MAG: hypothetical protein E3J66_05510 [Dehalococcoidia bacterium]|nr:MAG: hypothetical protein E3J66_05510 [Dehalococcoidia bacterium]
MEEELYKTLGEAKSREVFRKHVTLSNLYDMAKSGTRNPQVAGKVYEGIAKDFIREFLPPGFRIKGGLIFDVEEKECSPEIDAIIYSGVPLLEFTDAAITEKKQVEAILEIKGWIGTPDIFGTKNKASGDRNLNSELSSTYKDRRRFIQPSAKYILFVFALGSDEQDDKVINRLKEISDTYAIVARKKIGQGWESDANFEFDFNESISGLIKYLRNLSYSMR